VRGCATPRAEAKRAPGERTATVGTAATGAARGAAGDAERRSPMKAELSSAMAPSTLSES
jgi:hypothetical protein